MIFCQIASGLYLLVMSWIDLKKKEIPLAPGLILIFLLGALAIFSGRGPVDLLTGVSLGAGLWLLSKLTAGALGEGDALIFVLTGITLSFWENLEIFILALFLSALVSLGLFVGKRVGRKYRLAFLPFVTLAYFAGLALDWGGGL
ncbi:MAG: hypothetical protein K6G62_04700 [Eubacterium sp.]|nr:hypothetical protein [Eubacterium sp.]